MHVPSGYKLVRLANGAYSVHSLVHRETFHPVIGPVAEAEALYVRQIKLPERLCAFNESNDLAELEFVVWDIGLGAAANALTVIRAASTVGGRLRILSFDHTMEPLRFSLENAGSLGYMEGFEGLLAELEAEGRARAAFGSLNVQWELHLADFPSLIAQPEVLAFPKPRAILYDAYSPAKNPAMWTQPHFSNLFRLLDPKCPCSMPTYSRSTMLRVSLLLAGFYVGSGHPTGEKEETTIAATTVDLIDEPLDRRWLSKARNSRSAEPLWTPCYRQASLSAETWDRLVDHPQFQR